MGLLSEIVIVAVENTANQATTAVVLGGVSAVVVALQKLQDKLLLQEPKL